MTEKKQNITIRIADQPRIPLVVPLDQEPLVRRAEESINALWHAWRDKEEFKKKSSAEILAMVTFRFAQRYYANLQASESIDGVLGELEQTLDDLLLDDLNPA